MLPSRTVMTVPSGSEGFPMSYTGSIAGFYGWLTIFEAYHTLVRADLVDREESIGGTPAE